MLYLNEAGVNVLIKKNKTSATDMYWNNYSFIVWKKHIGGYSNTKGVYRNSSWGISEIFPITQNGVWELPKKYVKYLK
jgi:hypothetical protein